MNESKSIDIVTPEPSSELSEDVISLWKSNAKTLGMFPRGAFEERARERWIAAATSAGELCGYINFYIARGQIKITHLCIAKKFRNRGIAKQLAEWICQRNKSQQGIGLYCRRDNPAWGLWPKLQFSSIHEKPGRGADRAPLTFYWMGFGHPTLFSQLEDDLPMVLLDANVMLPLRYELFGHSHRQMAATSIPAA